MGSPNVASLFFVRLRVSLNLGSHTHNEWNTIKVVVFQFFVTAGHLCIKVIQGFGDASGPVLCAGCPRVTIMLLEYQNLSSSQIAKFTEMLLGPSWIKTVLKDQA